jgi:hypothetical protein
LCNYGGIADVIEFPAPNEEPCLQIVEHPMFYLRFAQELSTIDLSFFKSDFE